MKPIILWLMIISSSLLGCGANKNPTIAEINEKREKGQGLDAKVDIEEFLRKDPENANAWALLGEIAFDLNEDSIAEDAFERSLKIDDQTLDAWIGLGRLSNRFGFYPEAIMNFQEALAIDSLNASAYAGIALSLLMDKEFNSAVEVGLKAYGLDGRDPIIAANLSIAYHYAGEIDKRNEYYRIAENLGYQKMDILKAIFEGQRSIFENEDRYGKW